MQPRWVGTTYVNPTLNKINNNSRGAIGYLDQFLRDEKVVLGADDGCVGDLS